MTHDDHENRDLAPICSCEAMSLAVGPESRPVHRRCSPAWRSSGRQRTAVAGAWAGLGEPPGWRRRASSWRWRSKRSWSRRQTAESMVWKRSRAGSATSPRFASRAAVMSTIR